jgi:hypothetical protein
MYLNSDAARHSYKRNRAAKSIEIRSKSWVVNVEIDFEIQL